MASDCGYGRELASPPRSRGAPPALSLTIHSWPPPRWSHSQVRFRAEHRYIARTLAHLGGREARALSRRDDGERRRSAREARLRRWRQIEEPASAARLTAIRGRLPALRGMVACACERRRLQETSAALLHLPGAGESIGAIAEQTGRIAETAGWEELRTLHATWRDFVLLAAEAAAAEDFEWHEDQLTSKEGEAARAVMAHTSWRIEVPDPNAEAGVPAPIATLLDQREQLDSARERLTPLHEAEQSSRLDDAAAAPEQEAMLEAIGARLAEEQVRPPLSSSLGISPSPHPPLASSSSPPLACRPHPRLASAVHPRETLLLPSPPPLSSSPLLLPSPAPLSCFPFLLPSPAPPPSPPPPHPPHPPSSQTVVTSPRGLLTRRGG